MKMNANRRILTCSAALLLLFSLNTNAFARQNNTLVSIDQIAASQTQPRTILDEDGTPLAFWIDTRDGGQNIYLQHFTAEGAPVVPGGSPIIKASAAIENYDVVAANGGGFYLAWEEATNNRLHRIFLQRFDLDVPTWSEPLSFGSPSRSQGLPRIKKDDEQGVYIVWEDRPPLTIPSLQPQAIIAQRINEKGQLIWNKDGVDLVRQTNDFLLGDIASVVGALAVVWRNERDAKVYMRAVAINDGSSYSSAPIDVSNDANSRESLRLPKITLAENKGNPRDTNVFVVWQQGDPGSIDLFAQKLDLKGDKQWNNDEIVNDENGDQINHAIIDNGGENLYVVWQDDRDNKFKVYAQRINSSGNRRFSNAGLALTYGDGDGDQINPKVVIDRNGDIYCAWEDNRDGDLDVYAQHISGNGALDWSANNQTGIPVAKHSRSQSAISPLVLNDNRLMLVWEDARNANINLYAQFLQEDGTLENIAPRITSIPDTLAESGQPYNYQVEVKDYDNDVPFAFTLPTAPDWLQIDATSGLISGTPPSAALVEVAVHVEDNRGKSAEQKFAITVSLSSGNTAPTITSQPIVSVNEDETYIYQIRFSDPDVGDTHTFSADTLPSWLNLASDTGLLSGTPTNDHVGDWRIALQVQDQSGASDRQAFSLSVVNTNDPPYFVSTPDTFAVVDSLYQYAPQVADVDAGDELRVNYLLGPDWATWDENNRILSGTPAPSNNGESRQVLFEVVDLAGVQVLQSFFIHVESHSGADTTAPNAPSSVYFTQTGWVSGKQVTLNWQTPADRSGIQNAFVKLQSAPQNPTDFDIQHAVNKQAGEPDSVSFSIVAEGVIPAYLWFEDGAGNADISKIAVANIKVDGTPPTPGLPVFPSVWSREDTVRFVWQKATDAGAGIKNYTLVVEPQIFQGIVSPTENANGQLETTLALNIDGRLSKMFNWFVIATDSADNQAASDTTNFALDTTLPLIIHAAADTIPLSQSYTVQANVTDPQSGVAGIEILYRTSGSAATQRQPLNKTSGDNYALTLPTSAIQPQGFEYTLIASDSAGNRRFLQTNSSLSTLRSVVVQGLNISAPFATKANQYQMVSVPYSVPDFSLQAFFESNFGPYDDTRWRILRWQEPNGYLELTSENIETLRPGRAFWLITRNAQAWKTATVHSVATTQAYQIPLQPGWNMIATPYAFDTDWKSIPLPAGVQSVLWDYTGTGYAMEQSILKSWRGYFIENTGGATQTITVTPITSASAAPKVAALWDEMDWALQVQAAFQGLQDSENYIGVGYSASDLRDAVDLSEPPAIGKTPRLYFVGNAAQQQSLATDFRNNNKSQLQWDFIVENLSAGELKLNFTETKMLPDSLSWVLLDRTTMTKRVLRPDENSIFSISEGENQRAFTLTFHSKQRAQTEELVPSDLTLHPIWPNPYKRSGGRNVVFRFGLPRESDVELRVYNILGQEMYRNSVATRLGAGEHAITWNGRRQDNSQVAAGLYIVSLVIDQQQRIQRKMLVID